MPDTMHMLNNGFPGFSGEESLGKKMQMILDYQWGLKEELRYLLHNLQAENFNETGLREIGESFTKPIYGRLEGAEGDIATLHLTADELALALEDAEGAVSSLRQTVEGITLSVENGETSSTIKLGVDGVVISSQTLQFTGVVTFSDLETSGSTAINGDNITTGKISAERIDTSELRLDALYIKRLNTWEPSVYGEYSVSNPETGQADWDRLIIGNNWRLDIFVGRNSTFSGANASNIYLAATSSIDLDATDIYVGDSNGTSVHIDALDVYIGGGITHDVHVAVNESGSKGNLGFFGATPISRRSLSNSATVADVIAGLKAYGLFA